MSKYLNFDQQIKIQLVQKQNFDRISDLKRTTLSKLYARVEDSKWNAENVKMIQESLERYLLHHVGMALDTEQITVTTEDDSHYEFIDALDSAVPYIWTLDECLELALKVQTAMYDLLAEIKRIV